MKSYSFSKVFAFSLSPVDKLVLILLFLLLADHNLTYLSIELLFMPFTTKFLL